MIGPSWRESTAWWPPDPEPPDGAPNVVLIVLDDVGYAQLGCYGSDIETPEHRPARGRRRALRQLPHHRALLADPVVPAHRAQPPLERHGTRRRPRRRVPRLQRSHPARERLPLRDPRGQRVRPARRRQVAPHPGGRDALRRAARHWPCRARLPALVRVPRRRDPPVRAEPVPRQPRGAPAAHARARATTSPRTWPTGDPVPRRDPLGRARPAVLPATSRPARATRRTTRRPSGSSATAAGSTRAGTSGARRRSPASRRWGCSPTARGSRPARRGCRRGTTSNPRTRPSRRASWSASPGSSPTPTRRSGACSRSSRSSASSTTRSWSLVSDNGASRRGRRARLDQRRAALERQPGGPPRAARRGSTRSARRPRTTTTRGAGRWPATRRSGAGSARSTRAAIADPCIVHWPRGIAGRGEIRHQFAHAIDVLPTLLELIGDRRARRARRRRAEPDRRHELRRPRCDVARRARRTTPRSTSRCSAAAASTTTGGRR